MKKPFENTQNDRAAVAGTSETTPWLQHTRWAELFRNRLLEIIAATAKQSALQSSRNYLLGQWARATLDRSNEVKMMQHILYLVEQLQLGGDDHISDSSDSEDDEPHGEDRHDDCEIPSDSENTDTDEYFDESIDEDVDSEEDEEVEKDHMSDCKGTDFCLPTGYWLRLSEALFQLSMMFWTHQDPAGNIYATLVYEWPCREYYPSQPDRLDAIRKKYLIRGCYTPFGEIIELKAFAKSIVKREGIPGNLSWDPDGQSFTIGHDKKFKLSEFCATHSEAIKLVQERVDEMMLGLEVDINIDEIEDDLTCRKAGWSFIQDTKNKLTDIWERLADTLRSSSFRGKPFVKGTDWQVDTCIAYLDAGTDLSKLAFAASHFSGGLPGRGTEVTTIRHINTTLAVRNVFFRGGQMMMIISYNKARTSNNYAFYIVRYLPKGLSRSLLKYLAIIRPVLGFIARQLKVPYWSESEFFFLDPHGRLSIHTRMD
ncbi:hypothetical protein FOXYSP1_18959 [Fusarium oxysporum f. sp. phaseoli]